MLKQHLFLLLQWLLPLLVLFILFHTANAQQDDAAIRINAGGGSFTDDSSHIWAADTYYTGGSSNSNSNFIQGTSLQALYSTERFSDGDVIRYDIPLAQQQQGMYEVRLHFAEIRPYIQAQGERLFLVKIQNEVVWQNVDIFKEAGGLFQPLVKSHLVDMTNNDSNTLSIELVTGARRNAKISGIEVLPTTFNLYLNAGSDESYTDDEGNTWQADDYYNTGRTFSLERTIGGTTNSRLYQTERYQFGTPYLQYNIPIPASGQYSVTLHFSDNYKPMHSVGTRVFHVEIQGKRVWENVDLYAIAGEQGFTAVKKSWVVDVTDNVLSIELIPISQKGNPTICGIEIHASPADGNDGNSQVTTPQPTPAQPNNDVNTSPQYINSDFSPLYINAGSDSSIHDGVNLWEKDMHYFGGQTSSTGRSISGTPFGQLYQTNRHGTSFEYEIPIQDGSYQVSLHFAEIDEDAQHDGARLFFVYVEGVLILDQLDIYKTVGGYASYVIEVPTLVRDGALSLEFVTVTGDATLSAFSVSALESIDNEDIEPHFAHAVPGGPYEFVAKSNGKATVEVDGYYSHTHYPGGWLVRWTWMVSDNIVGDNAQATFFELPAGVHQLILEVEDNQGYTSVDYSTVTVHDYGYPDITYVWPTKGDVAGGESLTISGAGFTYSSDDTTVYIGSKALTGDALRVMDDGQSIEVKSVPSSSSPGMVDISVKTPIGTSTSVPYTYIDETLPLIEFTSGTVDRIEAPTCLAFGPDGRLYVGTQLGRLLRLTLDANYQVIERVESTVVADSEAVDRTILGIAFNPIDTCESDNGCTVYVSHSWLFHKQLSSPNGKVSAVSGPNLDRMEHLVTGLPVSDHDHGVNGLVFGDEGELYIQVPGNTNGGVPGSLSSTREQKEELLSSSTVVARNVNSPDFDGHVEYDGDGNQIAGWDVSVFAPGQRNSYGIVLHSNGYLYATDNGANRGYGKASVSCSEDGPSPHDPDELNVIIEGHFYGHPNRKRGQTDSRQCRYRSTNETSDDEYTGPIAMLPASSNGLCEFQTEHFAGQLRGHLIVGRWKGELFNVALSNDGLATETGPFDFPPVLIEEAKALDIVQGPDGSLFTAQHLGSAVKFYSPAESKTMELKVKSAFPRRGPRKGGSTLTIYGDNLYTSGVPSVTVGGNVCSLHSTTSDAKITCTLPEGEGTVDIGVTAGMQTSVLKGGYHYIDAEQGGRIEPRGRIEPNLAPTATLPSQPPPQSSHVHVLSRIDDSSEQDEIASLGVRSLVWVNTMNEKVIGPVTAICDACFDRSIPVTIRADTWGDVNSVKMTLTGPIQFGGIQNHMPHALFGDGRWNANTWGYQGRIFDKGSYTVTAQAFSKPDGQGPAGKVMSLDFEIM